jgi:hypothetical protein
MINGDQKSEKYGQFMLDYGKWFFFGFGWVSREVLTFDSVFRVWRGGVIQTFSPKFILDVWGGPPKYLEISLDFTTQKHLH